MNTRGLFTVDDVAPYFLAGADDVNAHERWLNATPKQRKHAREKARVRLTQLAKTTLLVRHGRVQFGIGTKPAYVFSAADLRVKRTWLKHDAYLWRFLRKLKNAPSIVAGYDCDQKTREDAFVKTSNGRSVRVEMDMLTESPAVVMERFRVLAERPERVLFVTLSRERIEVLKAKEHPLRDRVFFSMWQTVIVSDRHEWEDCEGEKDVLYPPGG